MVRYPRLVLSFTQRICAIPHFATYRAILVRYPTKTSTKEFCDTIAASIARYYRCNPESLKGGFANGGLRQLSTIVHNCRHFATKTPFTKGHESAQLRTIVHKLQGVALSPHLRAPIWTFLMQASRGMKVLLLGL